MWVKRLYKMSALNMQRYKTKHVELYLYLPVSLHCVMLKKHTEKYTFLLTLLFTAWKSIVVQGLLVIEASRSHSTSNTTLGRTPLYEWSARRRDLSTLQHNTHNRQTSTPSGGIRTRNRSKRAVADPRLRPRGHWDRNFTFYLYEIILYK